MEVIGLLEYSNIKKEILNSVMKTIFGSECSKGIFTEKSKGMTIPGCHMLPIHSIEAIWHKKDTPGSYLTSQHFCKVLLQTPRNIHKSINVYDDWSESPKGLIYGKSGLITEGFF